MAFPGAAGAVNYSGTFIPEIWSGKLVENFYASSVITAITNTDYEGEIANSGDVVKIRTTPQITIRDYTKGMSLLVDRPEAPIVELKIDKGEYFNTTLNDVDKVQSDIDLMSKWSADAAERMKNVIDTKVLGTVYADVVAANRGATAGAMSASINLGVTGTPVVLDKTNIIDKIVELGQVLDEQNAPQDGRFIVVPPWFRTLLMGSDLKQAYLTGDDKSVLRNGKIGRIDRFEVYVSTLMPQITDGAKKCTHVIAGHKMATTFATQMTKMETIRSETSFDTLMRGLQIWGFKVVKGEALVDLYCTK